MVSARRTRSQIGAKGRTLRSCRLVKLSTSSREPASGVPPPVWDPPTSSGRVQRGIHTNSKSQPLRERNIVEDWQTLAACTACRHCLGMYQPRRTGKISVGVIGNTGAACIASDQSSRTNSLLVDWSSFENEPEKQVSEGHPSCTVAVGPPRFQHVRWVEQGIDLTTFNRLGGYGPATIAVNKHTHWPLYPAPRVDVSSMQASGRSFRD
ncbi:hypothetical protein C7974DRAFT_205419 [Boeremia exigua]|uniref:uncharacterized protein n=1 Tax=Boeremia exigua TaxID=749465 RepID=UPI001E8E2986|nr:uncharacterized protein C7974DRAFT_205419 [Boeremia exigua]KAH6625677.1 hypothetical protein C7974DRAFT_205419 [Boeremia exigua]